MFHSRLFEMENILLKLVRFLFRTPKIAVIEEYKTRCTNLKEKTNYVEQIKLPSKLKSKFSSEPSSESIIKEVSQLQDSRYSNSMRRDLLGINSNSKDLRKRTTTTSTGGEEMNEAMKHHVNMQEKIAEDMLALTRSLKEQTETANRIIRKDTDVREISSLHYRFLIVNTKHIMSFIHTDC